MIKKFNLFDIHLQKKEENKKEIANEIEDGCECCKNSNTSLSLSSSIKLTLGKSNLDEQKREKNVNKDTKIS